VKADLIPLVAGAMVFLASLISLKLGLSVAIVEIMLGAAAGNLGLKPEEGSSSPALSFRRSSLRDGFARSTLKTLSKRITSMETMAAKISMSLQEQPAVR